LAGLIAVVVIGIIAIVLASGGGNPMANIRVETSRSQIQLTMEMEQDEAGHTVPVQTFFADFTARVRGGPSVVGSDIHAYSLTPSVARVTHVWGSGGTRSVRVQAVDGGTAYIRVMSAGGNASTIVTVTVDIVANAIETRNDIHFGITLPSSSSTYIDFTDPHFYFFPTTSGRNFDYRPNTRVSDVVFAPAVESEGVEIDGTRFVITNEAPIGAFEVQARLPVTRAHPEGATYSFFVHVFPQFASVAVNNLTDTAVERNLASLVRNNPNAGHAFNEFQVDVAGGPNYGIRLANANATLVHDTEPTADGRFILVANVEGITHVDVVVFPTVTLTRGGITRTVEFSGPQHRHIQHIERIRVEIRNVFTNTLEFDQDEIFAFASPGMVDRFEFGLTIGDNLNVNRIPSAENNDRVSFRLLNLPASLSAVAHWEIISIVYSMGTGAGTLMRQEHWDAGVPFGANFSIAISTMMLPSQIEELINAPNLRLEVFSITQYVSGVNIGQSVARTDIRLYALHSVTSITMPETLFPVFGSGAGFRFEFETNLPAGATINIGHFSWGFEAEGIFDIVGINRLPGGQFEAYLYIVDYEGVLIGENYSGWIGFVNGLRHEFNIHVLARLQSLEIGIRNISGGHIFNHPDNHPESGPVTFRLREYVRVGGIYQVHLSPTPTNASVSITMSGHESLNIENFLFMPTMEGVFTLAINLTSISAAVFPPLFPTMLEITIIVINPVINMWLSNNQIDVLADRTLSHFRNIPNNYRDSVFGPLRIETQLAHTTQDTTALGWRQVQFSTDTEWSYEGIGQAGRDITVAQLDDLEFEVQGHFATTGFMPVSFAVSQIFHYRLSEGGALRTFVIPSAQDLQFNIRVSNASMIDVIQPLTARHHMNIIIEHSGQVPTEQARVTPYPTLVHNPRVGFAFMVNGTIFDGENLIQSIYCPIGTLMATVNDQGVVAAHATNLRPEPDPDIDIDLVIFAFDSIRRSAGDELQMPSRFIIKSVFIYDQTLPTGIFLIEDIEDWIDLMGFVRPAITDPPVWVAGQPFIYYGRNPLRNVIEGHFRMGADLDFSGRLFAPIPRFEGTLVGTRTYRMAGGIQTERYEIQNLNIVAGNLTGIRNLKYIWVDGQEHYGLIAQNHGHIRGVGFTNVNLSVQARALNAPTSGRTANMGVVAAANFGTIEDVAVEIPDGRYAMGNWENLNIGGVVGVNRDTGEVIESNELSVSGLLRITHSGEDTQHAVNIGGIAGINQGLIQGLGGGDILGQNISINSMITLMLTATTQTTVPDGHDQNVGGIAGLNEGSITEVSSENVIFNSSRGNNGGVVGTNWIGATLTHSYSTAAIYARGVLGGVVGVNRGTVQNAYFDLYMNPEIRRVLAEILFVNMPNNPATNHFITNPFYAGLIVGPDIRNADFTARQTVVGGVIGINSGNVERSFASSIFTNRSYFGDRTVLGLPYRGDIYIHGARGNGQVVVGGVIGRQEGTTSVISRVHSNLFINYYNAGVPASPVIGGVIGELAAGSNITVIAAYSYNYYNINAYASGDAVVIGGIIGRSFTTSSSFHLNYTVLTAAQVNGISIASVQQQVGTGQMPTFGGFQNSQAVLSNPAWLIPGWSSGGHLASTHFMADLGVFQFPVLQDVFPNAGRPLIIATPQSIGLHLRDYDEYRQLPNNRTGFGYQNDRGGFNYIIPGGDNAEDRALLFLTTGVMPTQGVRANRYWIADLFTIDVNPAVAAGRVAITLEGSSAVARLRYVVEGGIRIHFVDVLSPGHFDIVVTSTRHERLYDSSTGLPLYPQERITFDVIPGITQQTVHREPLGPHAWTHISHNPIASVTRPMQVQRSTQFALRAEVDGVGWGTAAFRNGLPITNGAQQQLLNLAAYDFDFFPYFEIGGVRFEARTLMTSITVNVRVGAIKLEINQEESQIDGMTAAIFSGTLITDVRQFAPWQLATQTEEDRRNALMEFVRFNFNSDIANGDISETLFAGGERQTSVTVDERHETGREFDIVFTLEVESIDRHYVFVHAANDYQHVGHFEYRFNIYVSISVGDLSVVDAIGSGLTGIVSVHEQQYPASPARPLIHAGNPDAPNTAELTIQRQQLQTVVTTHFSETQGLIGEGGAISRFRLIPHQNPSENIHSDSGTRNEGGILTINTVPAFSRIERVTLHTDPVYLNLGTLIEPEWVSWEIALVQLVYNTGTGLYEHFGHAIQGELIQVSTVTYVPGQGRVYSWDGRFHVRTYVRAIDHGHEIPEGEQFDIEIRFYSIATQPLIENIRLFSIARPGLYFHFDDPHTPTDRSVQAVGTNRVFSMHYFGDVRVDWADAFDVVVTNGVPGATVVHRPELGANFFELRLTSNENLVGESVTITFEYVLFSNGNYEERFATLTIAVALFRIQSFHIDGSNTVTLINNTRRSLDLRITTQRYRGHPDNPNTTLVDRIDEAIRLFEQQLRSGAFAESLHIYGRRLGEEFALFNHQLNMQGTYQQYFQNDVGPHSGRRDALNFFLGRGDDSGVKFISTGLRGAETNFMDVVMVFTVRADGSFNVISGDADGMRIRTAFNIVTVARSDEANPIPITTYAQLRSLAVQEGQHLILMDDITINATNWPSPVNFNAASLDGNNFRIFVSGIGIPEPATPVASAQNNIGVFGEIAVNSVIKNLNLVLPEGFGYEGAQGALTINTSTLGEQAQINVGVLAGINRGIVTNVAVLTNGMFKEDENGIWVADFSREGSVFDSRDAFRRAPSRLEVLVNNASGRIRVGGLVGFNMGESATVQGVITNSRVLIDVSLRPTHAATAVHMQHSSLGGFVGENRGIITSSFFRDGNVTNATSPQGVGGAANVRTGGFVGWNNTVGPANAPTPGAGGHRGLIRTSYIMGGLSSLNTQGFAMAGEVIAEHASASSAGFVFQNNGIIEDVYTNIRVSGSGAYRSGFVHQNAGSGLISNVFVNNNPIQDIPGEFDLFANMTLAGLTQNMAGFVNNVTTSVFGSRGGAGGIAWRIIASPSDAVLMSNFEGFSLSAPWEESRPNIWHMTRQGPRLVSADHIAVSIRVLEPFEVEIDGTMREVVSPHQDYAPGTVNNPLVLTRGEQFNRMIFENSRAAEAGQRPFTPEGTPNFVDWNLNLFDGYIRLANNIDLSAVDIQTFQLIFRGQLDGNGLAIRGIHINAAYNVPGQHPLTSPLREDGGLRSVGLFSRLENATIRDTNFSFIGGTLLFAVNATNATYAGGLAGIAVNSNIVDVDLQGTVPVVGEHIVGGVVGVVVNFNYEENEYDGEFSEGNMGEVFKIENVTSNLPLFSQVRNLEDVDIVFEDASRYMSYNFNQQGIAGGLIGVITHDIRDGRLGDNDEHLFMRDRNGNIIPQSAVHHIPHRVYLDAAVFGIPHAYHFNIRNISTSGASISAEIVGGLIGVVEDGIHVDRARLVNSATNILTGNFYVGGITGINMGRLVNSEVAVNAITIASNGVGFIFHHVARHHLHGMTVGGFAGFNGGIIQGGTMNTGINNLNIMRLGGIAGENTGNVIGTTVNGAMNGGFELGGIIGAQHSGGTQSSNTVNNTTNLIPSGGPTDLIAELFRNARTGPINSPDLTSDPFSLRISRPGFPARGYARTAFVAITVGYGVGRG